MCGWPNTSEPALNLLSSLHHQPLLVVLRAEQPLELEPQLAHLAQLGVRHVELAWSPHPHWAEQVASLVGRFPTLHLGAASLCTAAALEAAVRSGLAYGVSPILDGALVEQARRHGLALVPGVMTPSEVHQARALGCPLVKLFPAVQLGTPYWRRLREPLGPLPGCIAAGGLGVADVEPWLAAGVDAVALGGSLASAADWEALAALVARLARHQRLH